MPSLVTSRATGAPSATRSFFISVSMASEMCVTQTEILYYDEYRTQHTQTSGSPVVHGARVCLHSVAKIVVGYHQHGFWRQGRHKDYLTNEEKK